MPGFRMKCRNPKCTHEFLRYFPSEEFDKLQYGGVPGIGCYDCGFPQMVVMRSKQRVKDGFTPGFQRNIRKHCDTYSKYKAHLKTMGLVELGYDDIPIHDPDKNPESYWDDDMLKKAYDNGFKITGQEADHLKSGAV